MDYLLFVIDFALWQSAHYAVVHLFGERMYFFFGHFCCRLIRLHIDTLFAVAFTNYVPFIELGVTTGFMPVGDLQRAKPLRSSG